MGDRVTIHWTPEAPDVNAAKWIDLKSMTATQSSTGWGGSASRAIDGSTSGDYGDNTFVRVTRGCSTQKAHRFSSDMKGIDHRVAYTGPVIMLHTSKR